MPAPDADTVNRLWLPRLALASCVRCVISRDTRGARLEAAQRFNHFPASPLCSIGWWLAGHGELLAPGAPALLDSPRTPLPGPVYYAGAQTRPVISWNPGPGHGMMLLLTPDALQRMTGIDPQRGLDRFMAADEVLPPDWLAMTERVRTAPGDDARVSLIEAFLEPRWQTSRPPHAQATRYRDWVEGVAMRAAYSSAGRTLRQAERRIKQWAGQPLRELHALARVEDVFFAVREAGRDDRPRWSEIAAEHGYADQSHLGRVTRRVTGFAPETLRRRIETDESFWVYRLFD